MAFADQHLGIDLAGAEKTRTLHLPIDKWVKEAMALAPVREAPHKLGSSLGDDACSSTAHRDPADALIVATAKVYELTLVTFDRRLRRAKDVKLLRIA